MSNSLLPAPHGNITMSNSLRASLLGSRDVLVLDASVGCLDASGLEKHVLPWTKSGKPRCSLNRAGKSEGFKNRYE